MISEGFLKYEDYVKKFSVPEGTLRIGDLAFAGADGLEELEIPDSVTDIGKYAFMNCYSLREIRMPERIESIGAGLFQNCWQLRRVRMPEGTETLGTDMFENCHALAEIWLPRSLKEAARTSLSGCRSLRAIHIDPEQIDMLPSSARYTAVMTWMEEHASDAPEDKSDDHKIIDAYVRDRQKSFLDLAINRRSRGAVIYMTGRGLLDEDALRDYLNKSAGSGRVEITALLLDSLKDSEDGGRLNKDPFI